MPFKFPTCTQEAQFVLFDENHRRVAVGYGDITGPDCYTLREAPTQGEFDKIAAVLDAGNWWDNPLLSIAWIISSEEDLTDEELQAWSEGASRAGDAATMLIADIARGKASYLRNLTAKEIETAWPPVTDSSSGKEIAQLYKAGRRAALDIANTWGSPWPEKRGTQ